MNPNIPYGPPMPLHGQPPQRRHDMSYVPMPPHVRAHQGYPQYYQQPMAPMMPQYPQQYPQNWYNPYQHPYPPQHANRPHHYYQSPPPLPVPQGVLHHGHSFVPPQHYQNQSLHHAPAPGSIAAYPPPLPSSTASTASITLVNTPPSRPTSIASAVNEKQAVSPATPAVATLPLAEVPGEESRTEQVPFVPPLPWLSVQDQPFPTRAPRVRRQVLRSLLGTEPVTFPLPQEVVEQPQEMDVSGSAVQEVTQEPTSALTPTQIPTPLASDAPSASDVLSDAISTQPSTPSSAVQGPTKAQITPVPSKPARAAVPVVPVLPILLQSPPASRGSRDLPVPTVSTPEPATGIDTGAGQPSELEESEADKPIVPAVVPPPTSWAALLRSKNAAAAASAASSAPSSAHNGLSIPKTETLGDVLNEINLGELPSKIAFLQPRGLVNTGNMCYMNSILQMLVFCTPFYEFLDRVAKRAPHTFKSETPLIDAMIMFMREYPTIDSTTSVEQLRLRLKPEDYERYGESFIPEYVYNVIRELPRFRDMRRGHQQDAQEFLGFLLEELHEECALAMRSGTSVSSGRSTPVGNTASVPENIENETGWMEVGAKQRAAVTRSSGAIATESPVTSIFGGKLRSELKISGNKLSVTLEPYQPLQLDIGSPQIKNILDALKGLTRSESMQGDFQSARGTKTTATKQVFIETLPPVLILHLKRFHYDASTKRVEKIWKKIGYPLELELPKEVFPATARNKYALSGLPKYRLIGVIYHHGKNANGGHYTVDIRRQDGREWIRVDDTLIRRVRSDDVAEGGSEEDPKVLAAALERHNQAKTSGNRFEQIDAEETDDEPDKVWNQVNGHSRSKSTMSSVVNGSSTPARDSSGPQTPRERYYVKDDKVAYLLFYQRIAT